MSVEDQSLRGTVTFIKNRGSLISVEEERELVPPHPRNAMVPLYWGKLPAVAQRSHLVCDGAGQLLDVDGAVAQPDFVVLLPPGRVFEPLGLGHEYFAVGFYVGGEGGTASHR